MNSSLLRSWIVHSLSLAFLASSLVTGFSGGLSPASAKSSTVHAAKAPWLCAPGITDSPCTAALNYQSVPIVGASQTITVNRPKKPAIDCFYVYPTLSNEPGMNASLDPSPVIKLITQAQAAPFTSQCRLFVPLYHQVTNTGLTEGYRHPQKGKQALETAYRSMLVGWNDYIQNLSQGRRFVLIGHSQGAALLIRLIHERIDGVPALRKRLVSALLIGGNLTVAPGKKIGGAFKHIPLCSSGHQLGCAIAYSSFYRQPPKTSGFGIPGQGVSMLWGQTAKHGVQVACVNPASFGKGFARLNSYMLTSPGTSAPYSAYPGLYRSACEFSKGVHWLHVTALESKTYPAGVKVNARPKASSGNANSGLHQSDVNLALQSLVAIVAREVFYLQHHR
ncbi:MAG: DUF3089 domain-containing protein [Actinomycetota bacterium]